MYLSELTDEELINNATSGDSESLDFIMERYKNLASKIARSYFLATGQMEDLVQEAMIGLYKACISYKQNSNAKFKTYSRVCIEHQIQNAIKSANSQNNKILTDSLSINNNGGVLVSEDEEDEISLYLPSNILPPEDQLIEKERVEEIKLFIENSLSKKEKQILYKYLQGCTYKEIAEGLGINVKAVDNAMLRIKTKLNLLAGTSI